MLETKDFLNGQYLLVGISNKGLVTETHLASTKKEADTLEQLYLETKTHLTFFKYWIKETILL